MTPEQEAVATLADEIVARAEAGISPQRLIADGEMLPFIRAYVLLRDTLAMMARHSADQHARTTDYMDI